MYIFIYTYVFMYNVFIYTHICMYLHILPAPDPVVVIQRAQHRCRSLRASAEGQLEAPRTNHAAPSHSHLTNPHGGLSQISGLDIRLPNRQNKSELRVAPKRFKKAPGMKPTRAA